MAYAKANRGKHSKLEGERPAPHLESCLPKFPLREAGDDAHTNDPPFGKHKSSPSSTDKVDFNAKPSNTGAVEDVVTEPPELGANGDATYLETTPLLAVEPNAIEMNGLPAASLFYFPAPKVRPETLISKKAK